MPQTHTLVFSRFILAIAVLTVVHHFTAKLPS